MAVTVQGLDALGLDSMKSTTTLFFRHRTGEAQVGKDAGRKVVITSRDKGDSPGRVENQMRRQNTLKSRRVLLSPPLLLNFVRRAKMQKYCV